MVGGALQSLRCLVTSALILWSTTSALARTLLSAYNWSPHHLPWRRMAWRLCPWPINSGMGRWAISPIADLRMGCSHGVAFLRHKRQDGNSAYELTSVFRFVLRHSLLYGYRIHCDKCTILLTIIKLDACISCTQKATSADLRTLSMRFPL